MCRCPASARSSAGARAVVSDAITDLERLRVDGGISQGHLASAAGIDSGYLTRVVAGDRQPSIAVLVAISRALGADLSIRAVDPLVPRTRRGRCRHRTRGRPPPGEPTIHRLLVLRSTVATREIARMFESTRARDTAAKPLTPRARGDVLGPGLHRRPVIEVASGEQVAGRRISRIIRSVRPVDAAAGSYPKKTPTPRRRIEPSSEGRRWISDGPKGARIDAEAARGALSSG